MELVKIHETYKVTDSTDNLSVKGEVIKELLGTININLNISSIDNKNLGYYNYSIKDNNVSVNYSCEKDIEDMLEDYSNNLMSLILERFN